MVSPPSRFQDQNTKVKPQLGFPKDETLIRFLQPKNMPQKIYPSETLGEGLFFKRVSQDITTRSHTILKIKEGGVYTI